MNKNLIPISSIWIDPSEEGRVREKENLKKILSQRIESILSFGQLQPILVEKLEEPIDGKEWKLVDGQTRLVALVALSFRAAQGEQQVLDALDKWGMEQGKIEATTREGLSPEQALMMEYEANDARDNFSFKEQGRYVRRIHDMLVGRAVANGEKWTAKKTAAYIKRSEGFVSQYLSLTDDRDPAIKSPLVQKATTAGAALKQLKIEQERQRKFDRAMRLQQQELEKHPTKKKEVDYQRAAQLSFQHDDCRDWIKKIPDNALEWFHWDPPWGGREGAGGAFASHPEIEMDFTYCLNLMETMFAEIWRTLQDGAWLVIWYTPVLYDWLRLMLQGHRFHSKEGHCLLCDKHILRDRMWLSENYTCRKSPYRFWVNPYPNYWRKTDRHADGHEIQRFFTKETEPFLLAGKHDQRAPILLRSDRGNVFDFPGVPREERRHVNHKPPALIEEILTCISVPGSLGGDAGAGSGSIIEGAFSAGRKVVTAELADHHWKDNLTIGIDILKQKEYGPNRIAPWLEDAMKPTE